MKKPVTTLRDLDTRETEEMAPRKLTEKELELAKGISGAGITYRDDACFDDPPPNIC